MTKEYLLRASESVLMEAQKLLLACGHVLSGAGMNAVVCVSMFIPAHMGSALCACVLPSDICNVRLPRAFRWMLRNCFLCVGMFIQAL